MPSDIELRSDTHTQPTAAMRQAMASAEVGDDVFGEDPTINRLEADMARLLGMQAAVFACSGTQSNQMAVWAHCGSGDELLIDETGHIANYEAGGPAALSGVSVRRLPGDRGRLDLPHLRGVLRPSNLHFSPTRLLCLENSTNLGGGATYPLEQIARVSAWAREHGLNVHLDGARLFNACAARGYTPAEVAAHCDTVSICFSKGLGCPVGSILVGADAVIARARRARKIFGGSLRQAGVLAAAALHALEHHVPRLPQDHAHARAFAAALVGAPGIRIRPEEIETNLVFFEIDPEFGTAADLSSALRQRGVRINPAGPQRMRACTHLDVSGEETLTAARLIREIMQGTLTRGTTTPTRDSAYSA